MGNPGEAFLDRSPLPCAISLIIPVKAGICAVADPEFVGMEGVEIEPRHEIQPKRLNLLRNRRVDRG